MVTLMARTFSKEEVTVPETIMAYIPIVPGIQVIDPNSFTWLANHMINCTFFFISIPSSLFTLPGCVLEELQSTRSVTTTTTLTSSN